MVGRAGSDAQGSPELVVGGLGALWRWRLELALLAVPAGVWLLLAARLGELAAGLVVAWALAGVLVAPGSRGALLRWLHAMRVRRRFWRARVDARLAPVRLGRLRAVPAGEVASIRVPSGSSVEERWRAARAARGVDGAARAACDA